MNYLYCREHVYVAILIISLCLWRNRGLLLCKAEQIRRRIWWSWWSWSRCKYYGILNEAN